MKKIIALLLCVVLLVSIAACAAPPYDTNNLTTSSTTTKTSSTTTNRSNFSKNDNNWEGSGGYDLDVYWYANDQNFNGLHGSLYSYIYDTFDEKQIAEIKSEIAASRNAVSYSFVGASTHFWVHKLNIPREKFVELNNKDREFHKDRPWFLENRTFSDEEIDDIYNLSSEEFNKKYKAPTAVLVGEVIYNFNWLYQNDIDLWQKQNFTVEQLQEAVDNAKKMENFPQGIAEAVEKKLNDYIQATNN